ncbi:MAG: hypothetical protein ABL932_11730 [Terricaulis sp.]
MSDAHARREGAYLPLRPFKVPRNGLRYDCERRDGVCPVAELRAALAREATLVRERDTLIESQATLSRESDHRFLNNLQMVSSLLCGVRIDFGGRSRLDDWAHTSPPSLQ